MDDQTTDRPEQNGDLWSDVRGASHLDADTDADGERLADERTVEQGVPEHVDIPFEVPVPDAIDQRQVVDLDDDDD